MTAAAQAHDFKGTAQAALHAIDAVLAHWLPDGKRHGHEYQALNPTRNDSKPGSFSINTSTGRWSDFATDDKGGDLVSLVAYLEGCKQGEADGKLADFLGLHSNKAVTGSGKSRHNKAVHTGEGVTSKTNAAVTTVTLPPPATAPPDFVHPKLGKPAATWTYHTPDGRPHFYICRYDTTDGKEIRPRTWNGKAWQWKALPAPRPLYNLHQLADRPTAPVLITEGEKAADAAAVLFPDCVTTTTPNGAKAPDKADISPLKGRQVLIWPDNDNQGAAYAEKVATLAHKAGAESIKVLRLDKMELPPKGDAADVTLTTVDAAALLADGEAWQDIPKPDEVPAISKKDSSEITCGAYTYSNLGISWKIEKKRGKETVTENRPLSNFTAYLVEEITRDDGEETELSFTIEGALRGRTLPQINVLSDQFTSMQWLTRQWGSGCIIEPGQSIKDRLRHAVQYVSHRQGKVQHRTIFSHTGWRKIHGKWLYLTNSGGIGKDGLITSVEVDLGELSCYSLPAPSPDDERQMCASSSYDCLGMAPARATFTQAAVTYLAPMADVLKVDFILYLEGSSRTFKSSQAAVFNAHFGADIDRLKLACNWHDTSNAIEIKLSRLKDTIAVIDDYAPQPSQTEQNKMNAAASRVIRNVGNRQGRDRLFKNLELRQGRRPRGMVVATGEQYPPGESITARIFGVSFKKDETKIPILTDCQNAAIDGSLAQCMADYLKDIAGEYDIRIQQMQDDLKRYKDKALAANLVGRLPDQVAYLMTGFRQAIGHWLKCGVIDREQAQGLGGEAWTVFTGLAREHHNRIQQSQPGDAFVHTLGELLATKQAHLFNREGGGQPMPVGDWGWDVAAPQGRHIGWVDDDSIHVLPHTAMEMVSEALRRGGSPINLGRTALFRQLVEKGMAHPKQPERSTHVVKISGKSTRVWSIYRHSMEGAHSDE